MKVIKEKTAYGVSIVLKEGDTLVKFSYEGNLDLYWTIYSKNKEKEFIITKENYAVYYLFETLYQDIENINLYDNDYVPIYLETEEEKQEYLEISKQQREREKELYRSQNYAHYNELFNPNTKTITWYSDETASEVANYLKIIKEDDIFRLEFHLQQNIKGYDEDFHSAYYTPIRFRNSGSRYDPFNVIFMKMYDELEKVQDSNREGHQIHIEEYLYEENKKLVRKNNIGRSKYE